MWWGGFGESGELLEIFVMVGWIGRVVYEIVAVRWMDVRMVARVLKERWCGESLR